VAGYNLFVDGNPVRREGYFTDLMTDEAITFIDEHVDAPFFLYVPFTAPHSPFQGPADFRPDPLPLDSPLWNQGRAPPDVYIAMIEHMDLCIGKILSAIDEHALAENTVVIFTSDNGGTRSARNTPLSGIKGSTLEGGIRVPGVVRWPGVIPAGITSDQACITMDFCRSIVHVTGAKGPVERPFDGIDILKLVADNRPPVERRLFWRGRRGERTRWAVRDGDLKYVRLTNGDQTSEYVFDLKQDVGETHNLLDARPEDAQRLREMLGEWEKDVRHKRGKE